MTAAPRMTPAADADPEASRPRRLPPVVRKLLRSQQVGLVLIIVALLVGAVAARRLARRRGDGRTVNNFFNSLHADPDRHRRELRRDHGGRRDDRDHLGRHRSVGRVGLRAGGRGDGPHPARREPTAALGAVLLALGVCVAVGARGRRAQRRDGGRPARPPVHHHARHACGSCAASPSSPARPRASSCPRR